MGVNPVLYSRLSPGSGKLLPSFVNQAVESLSVKCRVTKQIYSWKYEENLYLSKLVNVTTLILKLSISHF